MVCLAALRLCAFAPLRHHVFLIREIREIRDSIPSLIWRMQLAPNYTVPAVQTPSAFKEAQDWKVGATEGRRHPRQLVGNVQ